VDNLQSVVSLPVSEESSLLQLSTALLTKEDARSGSKLQQCRSIADLAKAVKERPVVVVLLRSGRFAAGVFQQDECLVHRTAVRYTVRKGQGKAQSQQDGQRRPQSMGAQLRRAGEERLYEDVTETVAAWKDRIQSAALILLSVPKVMEKGLFSQSVETVLPRRDPRIRRVPIDFGRPSFDKVSLVHSVMMTAAVRTQRENKQTAIGETQDAVAAMNIQPETAEKTEQQQEERGKETLPELSPLHVAARDGDLEGIRTMLSEQKESSAQDHRPIDERAGDKWMTPLHYAAESSSSSDNVDPAVAADCVSVLLTEGRANPCAVDARNRVPYFLASHEKVRVAFRKARAALGENYCQWDEAKVGPPLTDEDLDRKKEKETEKKRKKKARQKEKKAAERAAAEKEEEIRRQEEDRKKQEEEAKRVRAGLQPKREVPAGAAVCDFCQTVCKGRKRNQMFNRLEYKYCSTDCVQKHKRELMAAAALNRFGS
jgi:hypothetical protein